MPGPLAGLRVLELARILAGPWAGQLLADLGADVIKVEREGAGDDTRAWGPPFVPAADGGHLGAAYFHSANRGKRSIEVDFASAEGQRIVKKLAARSDVLIENFKVGGLAKFGLDYKSLAPRQSAPDLLLGDRLRPDRPLGVARRLRSDGAGHRRHDGPDRHGRRRADAGRRRGLRYLLRRLFGGRHPRRAGCGGNRPARAAMSIPRWSIRPSACLSFQALNYLVSGEIPKRIGNTHPNLVPYQVFPVADGRIIIATGNDGQFVKLCGILGEPQLAEVPGLQRQQRPARASRRTGRQAVAR